MAEVRLERARGPFGGAIRIQRDPYILRLEENPHASFSYDRRGHWASAGRAEPGLTFNPWTRGERYPVSSLPALIAGRAAERQGPEAGERYHRALFPAFFGANRDISDPNVLHQIAGEAALDVDRFRRDVGDTTLKEEVLAAHVAAVDAFGVEVVPTIIVSATRLEGAASEADYRAALEAALRGAGRDR